MSKFLLNGLRVIEAIGWGKTRGEEGEGRRGGKGIRGERPQHSSFMTLKGREKEETPTRKKVYAVVLDAVKGERRPSVPIPKKITLWRIPMTFKPERQPLLENLAIRSRRR